MILLSYTISDFHLFYDGTVDMQIWSLLTRSHGRILDTRVTVKARGPLVGKEMVCADMQAYAKETFDMNICLTYLNLFRSCMVTIIHKNDAYYIFLKFYWHILRTHYCISLFNFSNKFGQICLYNDYRWQWNNIIKSRNTM